MIIYIILHINCSINQYLPTTILYILLMESYIYGQTGQLDITLAYILMVYVLQWSYDSYHNQLPDFIHTSNSRSGSLPNNSFFPLRPWWLWTTKKDKPHKNYSLWIYAPIEYRHMKLNTIQIHVIAAFYGLIGCRDQSLPKLLISSPTISKPGYNYCIIFLLLLCLYIQPGKKKEKKREDENMLKKQMDHLIKWITRRSKISH